MSLALLAETTRGFGPLLEGVENSHFGAIAVVDVSGRLVHSWGEASFQTFTRSALKPFQALPFLQDGGMEQMGFSSRELALMCSSHSGEDAHLEIVGAMLERLSLSDGALACGCHAPLWYATLGKPVPPGSQFRPIHNNCSGKHTGFLAWCQLHGAPTEDYLSIEHPLQQRIRATVARYAGREDASLVGGIDGCSAPNYALPLERLAYLYARLAQSQDSDGADPHLARLFDAMTTHPELVSGTGRNDLAYMRASPGDWVAKAGADGVQAIGIRSRGLGIAIKIADGSPRALHAVTARLLDLLGLLGGSESAARKAVSPWANAPIRNHRGSITGFVRPAFSIA